MIEPNEILLKGKEVASFLNVSRALAYRLMQSGAFPTIRFGRSVRVKQSDLDSFVQYHRVISSGEKPNYSL